MCTPNKTGGISKTHLTPCRRIGLCRKLKPNTSITSTPNKFLTVPSSTTNVPTKNPVGLSKNEQNSCTEQKQNKVNNSNNVPDTNNKSTSVKKFNKQNSSKSQHKIVCSEGDSGNKKIQSKSIEKCVVKNDSSNSTVSSAQQSTTLLQENVNCNQKSQANKRKKLSTKKEPSHNSMDEISDGEMENFPEPKSLILTEKLADECVVNIKRLEVKEETSCKIQKPSRKRQILYSSDEDDFVPSQNSSTKSTVSNSQKETIEEIQKRIKQKQERLNSLQQASVYKKLHNIKELEGLTQIWKKGCQEALRHLLRKLREHLEMDMTTLMQNLKIPAHIISYNVDNDTFL